MQRLPSAWWTWSALGTIVLKTLIVLMLINFFPTPSHKRASLFTPFEPGASHSLWEEPLPVSQELDRECAQQSKQALPAARVVDSCPPGQQSNGRLWSVPVPCALLVWSFFPRKLPPPSTADDPFLS